MKDLLFGWITKGQYELSFLDSIIGIIEIFGTLFLICLILAGIFTLKEKIKNRKDNKKWKK